VALSHKCNVLLRRKTYERRRRIEGPSNFTRPLHSKLIKCSFVVYSNVRWSDLLEGKWLGRVLVTAF
jgi:hypothetical protein